MSLAAVLSELSKPDYYDEPPTQETALGQFLFEAITDLVEDQESWTGLLDAIDASESDEWTNYVAEWVDRFPTIRDRVAAARSAVPLDLGDTSGSPRSPDLRSE